MILQNRVHDKILLKMTRYFIFDAVCYVLQLADMPLNHKVIREENSRDKPWTWVQLSGSLMMERYEDRLYC